MKKHYIIAGALLVMMAGCSPKVEKKVQVTNPATGEKTDVAISKSLTGDKETTITNSKDGTSLTMKEGALPEGFPPYITVYQGAKNLKTMQANNGKGDDSKVMMVNFTTSDDGTKVIDFYRKQLASHGYTEKGNAVFGSVGMTSLINEQTEEALQIVATKTENKDETSVQLIFAKQLKQ